MEPAAVDLSEDTLQAVWEMVGKLAESYRSEIGNMRISPAMDPAPIRDDLRAFDFVSSRPWRDVLRWVDAEMRKNQLHAGHPGYFGLFNPAPVPIGIAADALTAAYNPQLAAWSHSPFAVELEQHLIRNFAQRFGYSADSAGGTFCTGGAEANHTALLCSLTTQFPAFSEKGVRELDGDPVLYVSEHAHHSWVKAARACGLGTEAVRTVAVDGRHRMDVNRLTRLIQDDRRRGARPCLVCGTAGTTNAGLIDPLNGLADVCADEGIWYHVDAAWGGAACMVPEYREWLAGIERASSITFDAHKFLSIPMGAGVFLTRLPSALGQTFRISTSYMPRDAAGLDVIDPYTHSLQWSRRFIGLKIFLPLAVAGWDGYADVIRKQTELGQHLRRLLEADAWKCVNDTPLPVICFVDPGKDAPGYLEKIAEVVVASGRAWISPAQLDRPVLRACITNFRSSEEDLCTLVECLKDARSKLSC